MEIRSRAKLAYIVAVGHSGSTLLDIVTGSIPGAFSTGELTYLPWQIYRRGNPEKGASAQMLCSCGAGFSTCPAWSRIISALGRERGVDLYRNPFQLKINLLQNEKYFAGRLSWSRLGRLLFGLAAQYRLSSVFTRLWARALADSIANNWQLFDTIAQECGIRVVVDSSKSIHRLRLLHARRPEDVRALVLLRDPRGVAYSAQKLTRDPVRAARGWASQNKQIFSILGHMKGISPLLVHYEDLTKNPAEIRRQIAHFLELPDPGENLAIDTHRQHLVAGNGMRSCGQLKIRNDDSWRNGLDTELQQRILAIGDRIMSTSKTG